MLSDLEQQEKERASFLFPQFEKSAKPGQGVRQALEVSNQKPRL